MSITQGIQITEADAAAARSARDQHRASESRANGAHVVSNHGYQLNAHDGSLVRQSGGASVQMAHAVSSNGAGTILSTARSASGSAVTLDKIDDNTIVKFGGTEGRVQDAIAAGFLRRDEHGRLVEVAQDAHPKKDGKANDDGMTWGLAAETESTLRAAVHAAPAEAAGDALNHVLEVASKGGELDLSEFSRHMQMPREKASEALGKVRAAFQGQADAAIGRAGITDHTGFYQWAQREKSADLRRAVHDQIAGRGTAVYEQLAGAYLRSGAGSFDASVFDDQSLHQDGIRTFTAPDGRAMVQVRGNTYDLKQALKLGLVAIRR